MNQAQLNSVESIYTAHNIPILYTINFTLIICNVPNINLNYLDQRFLFPSKHTVRHACTHRSVPVKLVFEHLFSGHHQ